IGKFFVLRLGKPEGSDKSYEINRKTDGSGRIRELPWCKGRIWCDRQRRGYPCEHRADQPPADVGGEAFAGSPQMYGVNARQIVSPEAELPDGCRRHQENSNVEQWQARHGAISENQRHQKQAGNLENTQKPASADDNSSEHSQKTAADEPANFLDLGNIRGHALCGPRCGGPRESFPLFSGLILCG